MPTRSSKGQNYIQSSLESRTAAKGLRPILSIATTLWNKSQQGLLRLGGVPWVASHSTASIATLSVWMVTRAPQITSN